MVNASNRVFQRSDQFDSDLHGVPDSERQRVEEFISALEIVLSKDPTPYGTVQVSINPPRCIYSMEGSDYAAYYTYDGKNVVLLRLRKWNQLPEYEPGKEVESEKI